jgi:hypothetical protein
MQFSAAQAVRPDVHSWPVIASNLSYLAVGVWAFRHGLKREGLFFTTAALVASVYHFCDEQLICVATDVTTPRALRQNLQLIVLCYVRPHGCRCSHGIC